MQTFFVTTYKTSKVLHTVSHFNTCTRHTRKRSSSKEIIRIRCNNDKYHKCKIKDIRTKKIGQQKLSPTAVIRPGNKCKATYQNVKKVLSKRRFSHYQIYENQSKAVQGGQYQEVSINMRKIYRLQTTSKVDKTCIDQYKRLQQVFFWISYYIKVMRCQSLTPFISCKIIIA